MAIFAENIKLSVSDQIITGSHEPDGVLNDVLIFSKLFEEEMWYLTNFFYFQGNYRFSYAVEDNYSGNQFGHTENRDGAGTTAGEYHVRLPDGRIQTVEYTVDYRGYHATVFYEGVTGPSAPAQFVHQQHEPVIYLGAPDHVTTSLQEPHYASLNSVYNDFPAPSPPPYLASYSLPQPHYVPFSDSHNIPLASYILPQAKCKLKF